MIPKTRTIAMVLLVAIAAIGAIGTIWGGGLLMQQALAAVENYPHPPNGGPQFSSPESFENANMFNVHEHIPTKVH